MLSGYLGGLPAFLLYFVSALILTSAFIGLYVVVTPHQEFRLIRSGNMAAVPAFLGAAIGFTMPMTTAMRFSLNWLDFVIWGVIAAIVQIAAFYLARGLMPDVSARIERGEMVGGIWLGGVALILGIINAASMTP